MQEQLKDNSQFTIHSSQFTVHNLINSQFTVHNAQLENIGKSEELRVKSVKHKR